MTVWDQIQSVAFIAKSNLVNDPMKLKMELDAIFPKLGKREIILVSDEKFKAEDKSEIRSVTYLSAKDFNFFGTIKNQNFTDAFDQNFDAIFICNELPKRISKLISKGKTKRIIGLNCPHSFVHINMDTKSSKPMEMLNFAKEMLSKITS